MLLLQRRLFGTQQELARALGVSEQALSNFVSRRTHFPRRDSTILAALGLEVDAKMVWVSDIKPKEQL